MKKIIIYLVAIQLATVFIACKKEVMNYEGKEGVYFSVRHGALHRGEESWPYQPYTNIDFVRIGKDVAEVGIKVAITGPVKNYDRTFGVEINPDSTTAVLGKHYEAIQSQWVIPSGATSTTIKIKLIRAADLETEPKTVGLRLVATPQLTLSFPEWDAIPSLNGADVIVQEFDASLHTLKINDVMVRPAVWSGSIQPGNVESGLFGVFTRRKMDFLIENLGLTYEDFASTEVMPMARQLLVANDATAILTKLYNEKRPVLEEDGRLMWLGTVPWRSYIGVPYVPAP